jgi:UDP-N-acetylglucosamine 2-epimerase
MVRYEKVLTEKRPELVLVVETLPPLCLFYYYKKLNNIKVAHVEGGIVPVNHGR